MRKKTVEKISVSIPIKVANTLRKIAKEEHVPLSHIVARACNQYTEGLRDYARDGALFSRAAFYILRDMAAVVQKRESKQIRYQYIGEACRNLARRNDLDVGSIDEEGEGGEKIVR